MGIDEPQASGHGAERCRSLPRRTTWSTIPFSPLDATDLVQVDAMMTGYSRPAPGVKVTDFTGASNDLKMFGQFIRNYLDKYNRWASPKFLFGESYGTFRSAGLSSELQSAEGIELNGVMLLGHGARLSRSSSPRRRTTCRTSPSCRRTRRRRGTTSGCPPTLQKLSLEQVVQQSRDVRVW